MSTSRTSRSRGTVVSITSASLSADGRAWRFARSLDRAGFRSLVVEGIPSGEPARFGIPIISLDVRAPVPKLAMRDFHAAQLPLWTRARAALRAGTQHDGINSLIAQLYKLGYYWKYGGAAYIRVPPADLYILHGFLFQPVVAARGGGRSVPYIYDAHDCYSAIRPPSELSKFERDHIFPFFLHVERACCDLAAEVTTVSDGIADMIFDRFGRRPKVLRNVQEPVVPCESLGEGRADLRSHLGLGPQDVVIVIVGNSKPGQAVEPALRALRAVEANVHLAFVGEGYDHYRSLAEELGIQGRAHFVGHVPTFEVVSYVASADAAAVIYTPLTENYRAALPNGFFQAIQAGLPVLAGEALPEVMAIVEKYDLGMRVDPTDVAAMTQALRTMAQDTKNRSRWREGARAAAVELNWSREQEALLGMVHGALAKRNDNAA